MDLMEILMKHLLIEPYTMIELGTRADYDLWIYI